jgi:phage/plasmid-like protein (TIGR03299 family)
MAHGIKNRDRVLLVGDRGWHGLGQQMDSISMTDLKEQFPFSYEKVPMFTSDGVEVEGFKAVITTDDKQSNGVVGETYEIINLDEMFGLANDLVVAHGTGRVVSAGSLHNREDFFVDLGIDREYRNGDDVNKPYIGISNNFSGMRNFVAGAHTERMVCANTLNLMLREVKGSPRAIKIRHTKGAWNRLAEAKRILGITLAAFDKADEEMHRMIGKTMNDAEIASYYDSIMPLTDTPTRRADENEEQYEARVETVERANRKASRIRAEWRMTLDNERVILSQEPNLWLAMNSVTKWVQHENQVKNESTSPLIRGWSNRFATGFKMTNEAHDMALSWAAKA